MAKSVAIVMPARYHSSRFPGKPLALIQGKPLIEWVYRRATEIRGVSDIVVATDHEDIRRAVQAFGGRALMTSADHFSGTDRVAAVARGLNVDVVVNLQGDEPLFPPALVEEMVALFGTGDAPDIVTAAHELTEPAEITNPNIVKVVMSPSGRALYFSRSPIPSSNAHTEVRASVHYRHVGIYAFDRRSLLKFADLPPTPLELSERLEQLRALENGMTIHVVRTVYETVGVDVPEDIKTVEKGLAATLD
jgi:3-deoxy-manno-octulosonate cytidylyltransferase (CMP-KDO synthetase)